ncbi:MAG: hypothetical protein AAB932_03240, partial [Patescibacteria group bacterium]
HAALQAQGKHLELPQDILIWTGGVKPNPLITESFPKVAKNGALVACGFSIPPPVEQSDAINKVSRLRGGVNELLHLFGNAVHIIYWRRESGGRASVVFRIEK